MRSIADHWLPKRRRFAATRNVLIVLSLFLLLKNLFLIVVEYRNYFPANFTATFLIGREQYFFGVYSVAFYTHIVAGPIAILLGLVLYFSRTLRIQRLHREIGRIQFLVVMVGVVPTGLVMATRAFSGPVAGFGFACQAVATATSMILAVHFAKNKEMARHKLWAERCLILLLSPILLRIASSFFYVTDIESDLSYQLSAWLSWLIPLASHQLYVVSASHGFGSLYRRYFNATTTSSA